MKDAVDRLTPLGLMVLALLAEGDMHPYEMIRLLRVRRDDRMVSITNGTMYHTVGRLERAGLLAEVGVGRDGNRPERTTYSVTDAGTRAVVEWVRRELPRIDRPAEFRVALAEAHNLERDDILDLLAARRTAILDDHRTHLESLHRSVAKGVPAQVLVEIERQEALLDAEVRWIDSLTARLDADTIPWGPSAFTDSDRYLAQRKAAQQ
ncbi:MAG: PadR family transcriptional regulator [Microbacterium sp.]